MAELPLRQSRYSRHFNILKYIGAWVSESNDPFTIKVYVVYKTILTMSAFGALISLFTDFYYVIGDFKKMTWNLCISALFAGSVLKNLYTISKSKIILELRRKLHENEKANQTPEDVDVNKMSDWELKLLEIFFYSTASTFVPLWIISLYLSYLWGPKRIPLPLHVPFEFDYDNELQYNSVFFSMALGGCLGILLVLETELSMFSILVQITREYKRFLKTLSKINEMYENSSLDVECGKTEPSGQEVNPHLRKIRTKFLVKSYCKRQQQLIEFTKEFELGYSYSMILQVIIPSVLIIVSSVQCILEYGSISMNLSYQMGYICIIFVDVFLVCWFATRLRGQCLKVGEEAYAILWYKMDVDIQKDIRMIIMRSQFPPKITSGKIMEMNLHAFMLMARNIYSWLALFKQLAFKT